MTDQANILVVEDEERQRETLVRHLVREGFAVFPFGSAEPALEELCKRTFDGLITDLRLPGMSGIDLVKRAGEIDSDLPSIVMTAFASVDSAVEALRAGAHDYVLKPLFFEELSRKLRLAIEHKSLARENVRLRRRLRTSNAKTPFIGSSKRADEVRAWIQRAADHEAVVLITGETGTGKEVIAHAIHDLGPRADEPMLTINVAALAANMIESELFGHERGAFTGADRKREGILRSAGKGTVFLDEIGELPLDLQAKLLRALEAREVMPIGADRPVPFEARILCATHRDLRRLVKEEKFREDLFYRINILQIDSPPLRDRREDVPALAQHLCERIATRSGVEPPSIDADAMRALCSYHWPGNVRELANVLERAIILADDGRIELDHVPVEIVSSEPQTSLELKDATAEFERRHIAKVLRLTNGNRDKAAAALGLSPATLYRRLDKLDLKGDRAQDVAE